MKKVIISISLLLSGLAVFSQQPERQVLLTLQEGETIIYGENNFSLASDKTSFSLVTRQAGNFFTYENAQRKGPYKELSLDQLPARNDKSDDNCAIFNSTNCGGDDQMGKYVQTNENYNTIIKFKDKTYGPYMAVMSFNANCSETKFIAVVMTMENKFNIINSEGKTIAIDGTPSWLKISADAVQGIVGYMKGFDPTNVNVNNINMAEFGKQSIIDITGAKYGPYEQNISESDFWFCKSGGSHWYLKKDNNVMRDGKAWKTFSSTFSACDMWVSEDGNSIGISDYGDHLNKDVSGVFPISYALKTQIIQKNGKQWIKWICLENQKELVVYQRPL